jgi:hypothetical protein
MSPLFQVLNSKEGRRASHNDCFIKCMIPRSGIFREILMFINAVHTRNITGRAHSSGHGPSYSPSRDGDCSPRGKGVKPPQTPSALSICISAPSPPHPLPRSLSRAIKGKQPSRRTVRVTQPQSLARPTSSRDCLPLQACVSVCTTTGTSVLEALLPSPYLPASLSSTVIFSQPYARV